MAWPKFTVAAGLIACTSSQRIIASVAQIPRVRNRRAGKLGTNGRWASGGGASGNAGSRANGLGLNQQSAEAALQRPGVQRTEALF